MQNSLQCLRRLDEAMMAFGKTIGFSVESIGSGEAVVTINCLPHPHNLLGYTHGGAIFSIADTALDEDQSRGRNKFHGADMVLTAEGV